MNENKCAICGQPIIGFWHEVNKKCICQACAGVTTVYDMYMRDIIPIKPDIIDGDATLAADEQVENFFTSQEPAFNN